MNFKEREKPLEAKVMKFSFMAGLALAAGERRIAEGYVLDMLAFCAFTEREQGSFTHQAS